MAEKDISKAPEITTISDMFRAMEVEIAQVKSRELSEGQGRVVLGYRRTQMKGAELDLKFQNMMRKGGGGNHEKELRMVHGERVDEKPPQIADKPEKSEPHKPNSTQSNQAAAD